MTAAATAAILLRESMRDYLTEQLALAASTGKPLQRYLWWDFPEDPHVWLTHDQLSFGTDYMVAPVVVRGVVSRDVYVLSLAHHLPFRRWRWLCGSIGL
jgi:alpha-glucosidase (family GH31 glycosyl hydrolase)